MWHAIMKRVAKEGARKPSRVVNCGGKGMILVFSFVISKFILIV